MARPRVFISSTYYDLKYIRSSLEVFVESLGFDPVLSERGDIPFTPDAPLDESCYREAGASDVYVLVIGGRYGSEVSKDKTGTASQLSDKYESVTKQEYKAAAAKDIPIYILIEKPVYDEYQTYLRNKDNKRIKYAHVDSVNIFRFIEEILGKPKNNPVYAFERPSDIEAWLRDQWAGLFCELIQRMSSARQLLSLTSQVSALAEINKTLKRYLEELLVAKDKKKSGQLISSESKRLKRALRTESLSRNQMVQYFRGFGISLAQIVDAIGSSVDLHNFLGLMSRYAKGCDFSRYENEGYALKDFQDARRALGFAETVLPLKRTRVKSSTLQNAPRKLASSKRIRHPR